jgi:hypothetical protein
MNLSGSLALSMICIVAIALLAIYVPTVYIRKTNKILKLLEQIEANTRKWLLALAGISVYNGVDSVKRHRPSCEPGAGSRAVRRLPSDRSSRTLLAMWRYGVSAVAPPPRARPVGRVRCARAGLCPGSLAGFGGATGSFGGKWGGYWDSQSGLNPKKWRHIGV